MSQGDRISLRTAREVSDRFVEALIPYCVRCEVAGSVRRRVPRVGDIDIVACPKISRDLIGTALGWADEFVGRVAGCRWWSVESEFNSKSRLVKLRTRRTGFPVQLFLCDPDEWGVNFAIRTGPSEFSHALVSRALDLGMFVQDLRLYKGGIRGGETRKDAMARIEPEKTPDESDLFRALGVAWIPPGERSVSALRSAIVVRGRRG